MYLLVVLGLLGTRRRNLIAHPADADLLPACR